MSVKLVSIDVGSKNIHLAVGKRQGNTVEIEKVLMSPTPTGAIKDGKIEDIHSLNDAMKKILAKSKLSTKKAVLTIQSTAIITRDIDLPAVKQDELDNMVVYEIEQFLPIVASEYVIEYTFLNEFEEHSVKKTRIRVAAMPKGIVDNYFNLIKEIGLKPIALDVHSNVVSKLFPNPIYINNDSYTLDQTVALIDLGHQSINVHIINKGKIDFSRIITLGGKDIDADIAVAYSITLEQAEVKKIKEGNLEQGSFDQSSEDLFNDILRAKIDIWIMEIQKIFQYYISRNTGNKINSIYLFGGTSNIKGISKYLEQSINIKTRKINSLSCIKPGKDIVTMNLESYINAVGGMIRYE